MDKKANASKIVVLGEARVGKTSLTLRFCKNEFDENQQSTLDASYLEKTIQLEDCPYKLIIWDTAGQEKYHALNKVYYRGAEGALIVYDITDQDSFAKVGMWVKELKKYIADTPIVIAGNKCDLHNRQIPLEEAEQYARSVNSQHFNTSAKSGIGVGDLFKYLAQQIKQNKETIATTAPKKKLNQRG